MCNHTHTRLHRGKKCTHREIHIKGGNPGSERQVFSLTCQSWPLSVKYEYPVEIDVTKGQETNKGPQGFEGKAAPETRMKQTGILGNSRKGGPVR